MTKPRHKPASFDVVTGAGGSIKQDYWYRLSLKALCETLHKMAIAFDDEVTLINTKTRSTWTVTPDGIWK